MGALGGGSQRESAIASKKKKKRSRKRVGIVLDMTPMVDIAFLLLTFFMLTTTMSKPTTMEINLPPNETKVEVAESNLLTLRISDKSEYYWNMGVDKPERTTFEDLRKLFSEKLQENPKLIALLKVDRKAKYVQMVDVLDEFTLINLTKFSLAPMTEDDNKMLELLAQGK
jgi:biopolymer transport protein ExbD